MSSTSEIQSKFEDLRNKGFDVGGKVGPEQAAGSGGRVQVYEKDRIYWHANTGAHEVHGGILKKYLEEGGPGANSGTGRRHFGYPISDEDFTRDGLYPISRFEFGDIIFVRGTENGVTIHGDFFRAWKEQGEELSQLLYPLTEPTAVAGGEAVYFERGCLWKGAATNGAILTSILHVPLLGKPDLVETSASEVRDFLRATWRGLDKPHKDMITQRHPGLFTDVWQGRLQVESVGQSKFFKREIVLLTQDVAFEETPNAVSVSVNFRLPTNEPNKLQERTLYDLALRLPDNKTFVVAPHAFYTAKDWENFGFIHVTDIHVAKRIELYHVKLRQLASQSAALAQAADKFNNFNDNFRDFIRYANHLHSIGLLDVILATGDLVDYGFDAGEAKNHQGGNYGFFEQLIRGQAKSSSGVASEELRVPIFTLFGNHDYRINPYKLLFDVEVPIFKDKEVRNYPPYNLTKSDAKALQGGHPTLTMEKALEMVEIDDNNQQDLYRYYKKRINAESAYILDLGPHRIIMLDTRFDIGIPGNANAGTKITLLRKYLFGFTEDEEQAQNGGPNLRGLDAEDVRKVRTALSEANQAGLVIVGMHAPPLNIAGTELAHYFRETEHPTSDRREVDAFLSRHGASGASADWPRNGTTHFKTGTIDNLLDSGIAKGETNAFLQACAGVNSARPVDLVLCGHNHDRVEYRLKWDNPNQQFLFFTDFYLDNPTTYYPSTKAGVDDKVHIRVTDNAPLNGPVLPILDHRFEPPLKFQRMDVPPYANPLNETIESKIFKSTWWSGHRPLIVETAALGPLDHENRKISEGQKPSASFQGFRHFRVKSNEIFESNYIVLEEMRAHNLEMPWEKSKGKGKKSPAPHTGPAQSVTQTRPAPGPALQPGTVKHS